MELIETRTHAHAVMPGNGESFPHQSTKNRLPDRERQNVSLLTEQPSHQNSPNEGERYEDGIRPMEQGEERSGNEGNANGAGDSCKETIGDERI